MTPIRNVQDVLQQSGRCANVVNAAVLGTAPAGDLEGVNWSTRLQGLIDQHHPQIVVIQFVGTDSTAPTTPLGWRSSKPESSTWSTSRRRAGFRTSPSLPSYRTRLPTSSA